MRAVTTKRVLKIHVRVSNIPFGLLEIANSNTGILKLNGHLQSVLKIQARVSNIPLVHWKLQTPILEI